MSEAGRDATQRPLTLEDRVRVEEGVLSRLVDGETVLVHLERGVYFGLDAVGTTIWHWIGVHGHLGEVLGKVVEEYDVDEPTARADLLRLVDEMRAQGLVSVVGDTGG